MVYNSLSKKREVNFMKLYFSTTLLILILSFGLYGQTDWHTYPVRSIAELINQHSGEESSRGDIIISANPFPSKTTVIYTGKSRPISQETKNFISLWTATRNVPPENADMLVEEFLFKEKNKEYWIPVLKKMTPVFKRELKEGDEIIIYYFFLGGYNLKKIQEKDTTRKEPKSVAEDKIDWIFAVETFQKSLYKIQSLADAIDKNFVIPKDKTDFVIDPRQVKSKSTVIFTGEVRDINKQKNLFIQHWIEKTNVPSGVIQLFQTEARFREGEKDYWLPVRKSILDEMLQRLKKGSQVEIHTILVGGILEAESTDWIFIVGEYTR